MEGDPEFLSHLQQLGSEYKRLKEQREESQRLADSLKAQNNELATANQELARQRKELLLENETLIEKLQATTQEKTLLEAQQQEHQNQLQALQQELQQHQQAAATAAAAAAAEFGAANLKLREASRKATAAAEAAERQLKETQEGAAAFKLKAEAQQRQLIEANAKLSHVRMYTPPLELNLQTAKFCEESIESEHTGTNILAMGIFVNLRILGWVLRSMVQGCC